MPTWEDVQLAQGPSGWKPRPLCCWCQSDLVKAQVFGSPVWVCPKEECHQRQLQWAMVTNAQLNKGEPSQSLLHYLPLPKQTVVLEAIRSGQYRRILYGGAAGGGKSRLLRFLAYQLCLTYKNFNVLLLRRTFPELEDTHIREANREVGPDPGQIPGKCTPSNHLVEFPSTGSVLRFGHCQDDKAMSSYLSREYDLILFDELVTFTELQYLLISSRARTVRTDGWTPMVVAGTNPGGPGSAWVTELFIHKNRDPKKYPNYKPDDHLYIQALLDDNPYVNPTYVEFLMDLDPDTREAYRWGRWDIFPGQYFKEFRKERHCSSPYVPNTIPRLGGMDWGYLRPGVFLWAVPLEDGRLYIEREYVFTETPPSEVAKNIVTLTQYFGWTLMASHGDPAMGIRNHETGEDIFETLQKNGLSVQPAKNERVNGWMRVREWLKPIPDPQDPQNPKKYKAALVINPDGCPYLVRTLPQLMQDPTKLEDVNTDGEDHAADALRYLLMSRPAPLSVGTSKVYPAESAGALLQAAMAAATVVPGVLGAANVKH